MGDIILVIDAGTTSTRAMLFAPDGACLGVEQAELTQHYPRPGWVEHDAEEIWTRTLACAQAVVAKAGGPAKIAGIGITNQRETICFWSRSTGRALSRAIVWQDRRTAELCAGLKEAGQEPAVQARTGLLLDPYFSGSKIGWAMAEWPEVAAAGDDLCIGTVESWLVYRLTGGLHVTDATNASRTALMDIHTGGWDAGLCDLFGAPARALPEIVDCAGRYGETQPDLFGAAIPLCGMAGDQQAAAIGQCCLAPGETKATYGTGAFVLTHTGAAAPVSRHRLLTTVAWQLGGERRYALEGSLFVAGSMMQWLRDAVGVNFTLPDLSDEKLTFEGARLLVAAGKPTAQLIYRGEDGDVFAICFLKSDPGATPSGLTDSMRNDIGLVSWQKGDASYVVVGPSSDPALEKLAEQVAATI